MDVSTKGCFELIPGESGKQWIVKNTFTVGTRYGKTITVEKGFVHDRFTFAPNIKRSEIASIVHDKITSGKHPYFDDGTFITRKMADTILRDLMIQTGSRIMAWVYYAGVRLFVKILRRDWKTEKEYIENVKQ